MIKTKSLNLASYISATTGHVAKIVIGERSLNHFEFENNPEVIEARDKYRYETSKNGELIVNLIKFNEFIRYYKNSTKGK